MTAAKHDPVKGALFGMGAMALFTVMNAFAKLVTGGHDAIEVCFYRNLVGVTIMVCACWFLHRKAAPPLKNRKMILLRAALGCLSLIVTFAAFQELPMANTQVLLFTSSLFLPILAFIFLKEKVGIWRICAVASGFIGVFLIAGPSSVLSFKGVTLALFAASLHAVIGVMLRHLGKSDSPLTITYYFMLIGLLISAPAMIFAADPISTKDLLFMLGAGISGTLAQMCLSTGYTHLQASVMAVIGYTGLIWATVLGWAVWGDFPTAQVWIGAIIVVTSNIAIIYREHLLRGKSLKL